MSWTWETGDKENWTKGIFETKSEAIEEAVAYCEEEELETFVIGRCVPHVLPDMDAGHILEILSSDFYGEVGEVAEQWMDGIKTKDVEILDSMWRSVFEGWLDLTNNHPTSYSVEDVETWTLEEGREAIELLVALVADE